MIHRLKAGRQLRLALVAVKCAARVLALRRASFARVGGGPWAESRLLVDVVGLGNAQVVVLRRLSPLIERILTALHVLSWLDLFIPLEPTANGGRITGDYLLSTRLKNAW